MPPTAHRERQAMLLRARSICAMLNAAVMVCARHALPRCAIALAASIVQVVARYVVGAFVVALTHVKVHQQSSPDSAAVDRHGLYDRVLTRYYYDFRTREEVLDLVGAPQSLWALQRV